MASPTVAKSFPSFYQNMRVKRRETPTTIKGFRELTGFPNPTVMYSNNFKGIATGKIIGVGTQVDMKI